MATILAKLNPTEERVTASAVGDPIITSDTIQYRKNIRNLSADELAALREAFIKIYEINDDRGYQYLAGIHGAPPPVYCTHGSALFAVWHRPYIYWLEKALQDQVPGVMLPYWDWTSEISIRDGMPAAFTDETWINSVTGLTETNPLLKANIEFQGSQFSETSRNPSNPSQLRSLANGVRRAQQIATDYSRYSLAIEQPHNGLHGWVGGTMGRIDYAAYDPIFWAHHANVDRQFAEWQALHPNIVPTDDIWNEVLRPFNLTTADIWDTKALGYEYITSEIAPPPVVTASAAAPSKFSAPVVGFALGDLDRNFEQAELQFHNVKHPRNSFEMRVFLNQPDADASTLIDNNNNYAGSLYFFGHGECSGDVGHCDPDRIRRGKFDLRPASHIAPFKLYLDTTECLRNLSNEGEVTVKLVAVDSDGNQVENPGTDFDAIALVTR